MSTIAKIQRVVPAPDGPATFAQADFSLDVLEMVPFPIAYVDNNNRYQFVNTAFLDWYDVAKEEVMGKKMEEFLSPAVYELVKDKIDVALSGKATKHELELPYKKGRRYLEVSYTPEIDTSGEVRGFLVFTVDVTERKNSQEVNARLAAIVQSSDDAIIGKTLDGTITNWNDAAEKLFGYTEQEMIGESIMKLIPKGREGEEVQIISKLKKGEKIDHFETKRITREGKLLDISLTISPIKDANGTVIGASKIARDITARKQIEELNARLAAIVQSSDDVIIGKTLDGIVSSWNDAAEKLFGYTEEEMVGQSILKIIPPERVNEEYEILDKLRQGKKIEHFETKRVSKSGKLIDISLTTSPIKDLSGNIIGASKIAKNISLQKKTARLIHENEERFRMAVEMTSWNPKSPQPENSPTPRQS